MTAFNNLNQDVRIPAWVSRSPVWRWATFQWQERTKLASAPRTRQWRRCTETENIPRKSRASCRSVSM